MKPSTYTYSNILIILFSGLLITSCSDTDQPEPVQSSDNVVYNPEYGPLQANTEAPAAFTTIQTFGNNPDQEEAALSSFSDIFTDEDLNLYVMDAGSNQLLSFAPDGSLRWATGQEGNGPGDFQQARTMAWDGEDHMYIANIYGNRIDKFDLDGNFVESLDPNQVMDMKRSVEVDGFADGKLIFSRGIQGAFAQKFFMINPSEPSVLLDTVNIDLPGDEELDGVGNSFPNPSIIDGMFVVPGLTTYELYFYEIGDTTLSKKVERAFDKLVPPAVIEDNGGVISANFGGINEVLKLNNGHFLTSASWPLGIEDPGQFLQDLMSGQAGEMETHSIIDLFDADWNLLYSWEAENSPNPEIGRPLHVDQEGNIYSVISEPVPHILKQQVSIND